MRERSACGYVFGAVMLGIQMTWMEVEVKVVKVEVVKVKVEVEVKGACPALILSLCFVKFFEPSC